jgi:hypothetical protein
MNSILKTIVIGTTFLLASSFGELTQSVQAQPGPPPDPRVICDRLYELGTQDILRHGEPVHARDVERDFGGDPRLVNCYRRGVDNGVRIIRRPPPPPPPGRP